MKSCIVFLSEFVLSVLTAWVWKNCGEFCPTYFLYLFVRRDDVSGYSYYTNSTPYSKFNVMLSFGVLIANYLLPSTCYLEYSRSHISKTTPRLQNKLVKIDLTATHCFTKSVTKSYPRSAVCFVEYLHN